MIFGSFVHRDPGQLMPKTETDNTKMATRIKFNQKHQHRRPPLKIPFSAGKQCPNPICVCYFSLPALATAFIACSTAIPIFAAVTVVSGSKPTFRLAVAAAPFRRLRKENFFRGASSARADSTLSRSLPASFKGKRIAVVQTSKSDAMRRVKITGLQDERQLEK